MESQGEEKRNPSSFREILVCFQVLPFVWRWECWPALKKKPTCSLTNKSWYFIRFWLQPKALVIRHRHQKRQRLWPDSAPVSRWGRIGEPVGRCRRRGQNGPLLPIVFKWSCAGFMTQNTWGNLGLFHPEVSGVSWAPTYIFLVRGQLRVWFDRGATGGCCTKTPGLTDRRLTGVVLETMRGPVAQLSCPTKCNKNHGNLRVFLHQCHPKEDVFNSFRGIMWIHHCSFNRLISTARNTC